MSWIMLNLSRHLATVADFANWLEGTYLFYGASRLISCWNFRNALPRIHARSNTPLRVGRERPTGVCAEHPGKLPGMRMTQSASTPIAPVPIPISNKLLTHARVGC
jgi:hypothetical protein